MEAQVLEWKTASSSWKAHWHLANRFHTSRIADSLGALERTLWISSRTSRQVVKVMTVWRPLTSLTNRDLTMLQRLWWVSSRRNNTWWLRKVITSHRTISTWMTWKVTANQAQSTTYTRSFNNSKTIQSAISKITTTARWWEVLKTQSNLLSWSRGMGRNSNAYHSLWIRWWSATLSIQFKPKKVSNGAKINPHSSNYSMTTLKAPSQRD